MAVQLILKNSSVEDKRPVNALAAGEISLNYNTAGAFLCCEDSDGNLQQVGGVKISELAPDSPVKQTLWFNPDTLVLFIYDGTTWLPIGGSGGGGGGGDIVQIIGNEGIDANEVGGIVTLDIDLAGGDDGLEIRASKLSASIATDSQLGSVKIGDGIDVTADGTISVVIPAALTYRGSCNLNLSPVGQLVENPPLLGDAYINGVLAPTIEAGWTGIGGGSSAVGDIVAWDGTEWELIQTGGEQNQADWDQTDANDPSYIQNKPEIIVDGNDEITNVNVDLDYTAAADRGTVTNNRGTDAEIPFATAAEAGLFIEPPTPASGTTQYARQVTDAGAPSWSELLEDPPVIISETAPTGDDAVAGKLWFNSNDGRTYVYYTDENDDSYWIDASPEAGAPPVSLQDLQSVTDEGFITTNSLQCSGFPESGAADGAIVRKEGLFQASRAADKTLFAGYTTGATGATSQITSDGDAFFRNDLVVRNDVKVGGVIPDEGNIQLTSDGTVKVGGLLPDAPEARIQPDGRIYANSIAPTEQRVTADIAPFAIYGNYGNASASPEINFLVHMHSNNGSRFYRATCIWYTGAVGSKPRAIEYLILVRGQNNIWVEEMSNPTNFGATTSTAVNGDGTATVTITSGGSQNYGTCRYYIIA